MEREGEREGSTVVNFVENVPFIFFPEKQRFNE
jgi:hypothetical protein